MIGKRAKKRPYEDSFRPQVLWAARVKSGAHLPLFLLPDTIKRTKKECRLALRAVCFWDYPNGNLALKKSLSEDGYLEIVRVNITPEDVVDKTMSSLWTETIPEFRQRFVEHHREEISHIFREKGWTL